MTFCDAPLTREPLKSIITTDSPDDDTVSSHQVQVAFLGLCIAGIVNDTVKNDIGSWQVGFGMQRTPVDAEKSAE